MSRGNAVGVTRNSIVNPQLRDTVIGPQLNDPVTKAVVDNIMGNLPTKKPPVRCNDCDLCFTSQTVLECHLQGTRHAKQVNLILHIDSFNWIWI